MKRRLLIPLSVFVLAISATARGDTDAEVQARKDALDVAAAFSNDGFKIRDGHWCGVVKPHDHSLVAVNLYAGNQYWFSASATEPAKKIAVSVYDETGKQVTDGQSTTTEKKLRPGLRHRAVVSTLSRSIWLKASKSTFCLVYSYK